MISDVLWKRKYRKCHPYICADTVIKNPSKHPGFQEKRVLVIGYPRVRLEVLPKE